MTQSKQTNGIDPEVGKSYVSRIERLEGEIESERGKYMAAAKRIREDIKTVISEAKDDGIPKRALKSIIATRKLDRKKAKIENGIDDIDDQAAFEQLKEALGDYADTPLGEAALDNADVRPRFNQDGENAPAGAI